MHHKQPTGPNHSPNLTPAHPRPHQPTQPSNKEQTPPRLTPTPAPPMSTMSTMATTTTSPGTVTTPRASSSTTAAAVAAEIAVIKGRIATLEKMTDDARFRVWSIRQILILAGYNPRDRMLDGCDCPPGIERIIGRMRVHEDTVRIGLRSIQLSDETWKTLKLREEERLLREEKKVEGWLNGEGFRKLMEIEDVD